MKQFTNLNITTNDKNFNYLVEFKNDAEMYSKNTFSCVIKYNENRVIIYNKDEVNLDKHTNIWNTIDKIDSTSQIQQVIIEKDPKQQYDLYDLPKPEYVDMANLILYFPRHSVETYKSGVKYSLCMKTWVNGIEIVLGNYLIDRTNALATKKLVTYNNIEYYECIIKNIIDPWQLQYSDDWKDFREQVCGQHGNMNNTGSNLFIELQPLEYSVFDNYYVKLSPYQGCSNSVLLSNDISNFMSVNISHNLFETNNNPTIVSNIIYNDNYEKTWEGFKKYMFNTYHTTDMQLQYELVVKDNDSIYKYISHTQNNIECLFPIQEIGFNNWGEWKDGLKFNLVLTVFNKGNDILILKSNDIDITKEIFKFLIKTEIKNINLDKINMKVYNLNVVNKIQKNIVQIERPSDYKANIIKPVFYQVQELPELQLHAGLTENICLNLDEYKNKVEIFYLQIDGIIFNELGRTAKGIIFKIVNNKIKTKSGNYYLLDQNSNMITVGKYKII